MADTSMLTELSKCWQPGMFTGKVVVVTGGAGSICSAQTEALVALGADAAIIGRNVEKTTKAAVRISQARHNARVLPIGGVDVRDVQALRVAVSTIVAELGHIDFLIAGAAGNFLAPFANLSENAFKTVVDIDLLGSFNLCKAAFDQLRQNRGRILFVSATLHYRGQLFQAHAAAAKSGIDALVKSLAVELGPIGIQVNALAPGAISNTEGLSRLLPGDFKARLTEMVPLGRLGTIMDIANASIFLFSNAASYVSGHVLVVDGGQWLSGGPETAQYPDVTVGANGLDSARL